MKLETLKTIINAFHAASDDATRYHMTHVLLRPMGNKFRIVATDGYMLSDVTVEDPGAGEFVQTDYLVAPEMLASLKALVKEFKNQGVLPQKQGEKGCVAIGASFVVPLRTARDMGIEYPDFERVIPKLNGERVTMHLNAEFLHNLAKAMTDDPRGLFQVTLEQGAGNSPILVTYGNNTGVLMPWRPDRLKAKLAKAAAAS